MEAQSNVEGNEMNKEMDVESPTTTQLDNSKETFKSALHQNIETKGENAYYYAWKQKPTSNTLPPEPHRPLSVSSIALSLPCCEFSSYSWADYTKSVKLYFSDAEFRNVEKERISLDCTPNSVNFQVRCSKDIKRLCLTDLFDEIVPADCLFTIKDDRITVSLIKKPSSVENTPPATWTKLQKDK